MYGIFANGDLSKENISDPRKDIKIGECVAMRNWDSPRRNRSTSSSRNSNKVLAERAFSGSSRRYKPRILNLFTKKDM